MDAAIIAFIIGIIIGAGYQMITGRKKEDELQDIIDSLEHELDLIGRKSDSV